MSSEKVFSPLTLEKIMKRRESQIVKPQRRRSKYIVEKNYSNNDVIDSTNIDIDLDNKNIINEIVLNNNVPNNIQFSNSLRRRSQILIDSLINDNKLFNKNNSDIGLIQNKYKIIEDIEESNISSPIHQSSPLKLSSLSFSPMEKFNDDNINIPSTIQRRRASTYLYLPPSNLDINQKNLYIALMKWMHFLILKSTKKKIVQFSKSQILKQQSKFYSIESKDNNKCNPAFISIKSLFLSPKSSNNEIKKINIPDNKLLELNEINNNNIYRSLMKWIKYVYLRRRNHNNMYLNVSMVIKIREVWIQDILLNKFISWMYNKTKLNKLNLISNEWRENNSCKKFFKLIGIKINLSRKVKYQIIEKISSRSLRKSKIIIMNGIHIKVWKRWMRWIFGSILIRANFNIKMVCFISRSNAHWKFNSLTKYLLIWMKTIKKSKKNILKKYILSLGYSHWRQNQLSKYLQSFLSTIISIKINNRSLKISNIYYRKKCLQDILRFWWRVTYQRMTLKLERHKKRSNNNKSNELIHSQKKLINQQKQIKRNNYEELNIVGNSLRFLINRAFIKDIFQDWKLILRSNSHFRNVLLGKFLLICYSRSISRSFSQQMFSISDISHFNYKKRFVLKHLKLRVKESANQLQYLDKKISKSINEKISSKKSSNKIKLNNVNLMLNDLKNNINFSKNDKINNHSNWLNEDNESSNYKPPVNPTNIASPPLSTTNNRKGKKNHL